MKVKFDRMKTRFTFSPGRFRKRWFCYLDLLGFTIQVQSGRIEDVMVDYEDAIGDLRRSKSSTYAKTVMHSWFSDTFIIYSTGDSPALFAAVEQVGRLFFQRLIMRGVPVRGSLTHGSLYSQAKRNVFVGPALIDAYYHAENQNWLGFVLTPKAIARMADIGVPVEQRPFYRVVPKTYMKEPITGPIYGFSFNNGMVQGQNPYRQSMLAMKEEAGSAFSKKYDNTLDFIG